MCEFYAVDLSQMLTREGRRYKNNMDVVCTCPFYGFLGEFNGKKVTQYRSDDVVAPETWVCLTNFEIWAGNVKCQGNGDRF